MVEEVGVGLADFRGHGLQRHRLGAMRDQQPARRLERGGAAFFGAETFAWGY